MPPADTMTARWNHSSSELTIDWSQLLGHDCELRVAGWDAFLSATTSTHEEIQSVELASLGDWFYQLADPAVLEWKNTIPDKVASAVDCLPSRKLAILALIRRMPQARDLLVSNPLLLWLLYSQYEQSPLDEPEWNSLLRKRQRDLLEQLGIDGTARNVKILRKFGGIAMQASDVNLLIEVLSNEPVCQHLAHLKSPNASHLRILRKFPWIASCKAKVLLPSLIDPHFHRNFADTANLLEDLAPLKQCESMVQVCRLHDRLVEELNRRPSFKLLSRSPDGDILPFPRPPLPATQSIKPITSQQELIREGHSMRHCIATYIPRVLQGNYYVYAGEFDARVTIGVAIDERGRCSIDDIRGVRNRQASVQAERAVMSWIED